MLVGGRNLDIITSARLIHSYSGIIKDYELLRRAYLFCEMANKLTPEPTSKALFELLAMGLSSLDKGYAPVLVELYFKLHLLKELGYQPELTQAVKAREEILAGKRYFFNTQTGGVSGDAELAAEATPISSSHIKLWRLVFDYPLDRISRIGSVEQAARESLPIANDFYDYLFGKRFKSSEI